MNRRGFALIAALWLVVAISAVALDLSLATRERGRIAINVETGARLREAALGGLEEAHAVLDEHLTRNVRLGDALAAADPWHGAGTALSRPSRIGAVEYRLMLDDPGARLNLNHATEEQLRRLMIAVRIDAGVADRLAQAILDWRDPDHLRRGRGAEAAEYRGMGLPVEPRNGPFERVAEMRDVLGMTSQVFGRVSVYLTTVGDGRVSLVTTPREVLLSLPGVGDEAVARILALRRRGLPIALGEIEAALSPGARAALTRELPALALATTSQQTQVHVRSIASDPSGRTLTAEALFTRTPTAVFLTWWRTE
ncbi:MAG: general secretion pathway protein GspK [Gemmatimonadales bacterium]